jgi:hypothetical protein
MRLHKVTSIFMVAIAGIALPQSSRAQVESSEPVSKAELRELLIKIAELLDRPGNKTGAALNLRQRIDSMDAVAFDRLYQSSSNWKKLRIAVALMSERESSGEKGFQGAPGGPEVRNRREYSAIESHPGVERTD